MVMVIGLVIGIVEVMVKVTVMVTIMDIEIVKVKIGIRVGGILNLPLLLPHVPRIPQVPL